MNYYDIYKNYLYLYIDKKQFLNFNKYSLKYKKAL